MHINKVAKIFGIVLVLIGILGFIPGVTSNGMLLGIFQVSAVHNIIHLLTGIIALMVSKKGEHAARTFFKVFGVIYLLVLIIGMVQGDTVLGLFGVNMADHLLHLIIAALALWYGFKGSRGSAMPSAPQM